MLAELLLLGLGKLLYDTVTESPRTSSDESDSPDHSSPTNKLTPPNSSFTTEYSMRLFHEMTEKTETRKRQQEEARALQREANMRSLQRFLGPEITDCNPYLPPVIYTPRTAFETLAEKTSNPIALAEVVAEHQERVAHIAAQESLTTKALDLLATRPDLHHVRLRSGGVNRWFGRSDPHVWVDVDIG